MSTKIYVAYKAKQSEWWELSYKLTRIARERAAGIIRGRAESLLGIVTAQKGALSYFRDTLVEKFPGIKDRDPTLGDCFQFLRIKFREQYTSGSRSDFDFRCWLSVYPSKRDVLVIPGQGDAFRDVWKFLGRHLKFYGYWNNTDPQVGISKKEWDVRGERWEKALQGALPHTLYVCDLEEFYLFDPTLPKSLWQLKRPA